MYIGVKKIICVEHKINILYHVYISIHTSLQVKKKQLKYVDQKKNIYFLIKI